MEEAGLFINILFYTTYALIVVAAIGTILGISLAIFQNFKDGGMYAVAGLVLILVLFGIGFALSSDQMSEALMKKGFTDAGTYKLVGAGVITFYALGIIASILVAVDIVKGIVNG